MYQKFLTARSPVRVLEKGLHVLTEKPMTCTSAHARDLIKRQKKTGKVVGTHPSAGKKCLLGTGVAAGASPCRAAGRKTRGYSPPCVRA